MTEWLNPDLLAKLGFSILCGGLIGLEREFSDKPAGLRTNILICTGSMLFTVASSLAAGASGDPGRVTAQIVTGVGFLGAGTILHSRGRITGLTSAATIWVVAAIGVWIGLGRYPAAVQATLCVLVVLALLHLPEKHIGGQPPDFGRLRLSMSDSPEALLRVTEVFRRHGIPVERIDTAADEKGRVVVGLRFPLHHRDRERILSALRVIEGVHSVKETLL